QVANQEGLELLAAGGVHVAVGMALFDVARIEAVDLFVEMRRGAGDLQVRVALEDPPLLAIGGEALDRNAGGNARIAVLAMGAVQVIAAAPETHFRQLGVHARIHGLAGVQKERSGLLTGQVAAWMW